MATDFEERFRAAAFAHLESLARRSGGLVRREQLEAFVFEDRRVPLIARQRGIWKPSGFVAALSFTTTFAARPDRRPYDDSVGPDGYPRYKWQGTNPLDYDNVALRRAMEDRIPLMWFVGVAPGTSL